MVDKYIKDLISETHITSYMKCHEMAQDLKSDIAFFEEYMLRSKKSKLDFTVSIHPQSGKLMKDWLDKYRSYLNLGNPTISNVFLLNDLLKVIVRKEDYNSFEKLAYIDAYFQHICGLSIYTYFKDYIQDGHHKSYAYNAMKWRTESEFKVEGIDV